MSDRARVLGSAGESVDTPTNQSEESNKAATRLSEAASERPSEARNESSTKAIAETYQSAARIIKLADPRIQELIGRNGMALDTPENRSGLNEFGTYKTMQEILKTTGLANQGWTVMQTEKYSPLDHINADYVLFNNKTGQLFFLDVTSTQNNQQKRNHPYVTVIDSRPSLFDGKTAKLNPAHPEAASFIEKTTETLRKLASGESNRISFYIAIPRVTPPVPAEQLFPMPSGLQSLSEREFRLEMGKTVDYLQKRFENGSAREKLHFADWMLSIETAFNKWKEVKWKNPNKTELITNSQVRNEFRIQPQNRFGRNVGKFGAVLLIPPVLEIMNPDKKQPSANETW